jgi:serine/threonine protein kinase
MHPAASLCFSLSLSDPTERAALPSGTLLAGRYSIVRTIHRGGMSVVYLAEDRTKNQYLALKELRLPEGAGPEGDQEAETWFARESYLLSSLRHPLIPAFYSVFREGGRSYIALEYLQGENLDDLVRQQGPQDPQVVAAWGQALCELLSYLHRQDEPVIFRDLKPANILLRPDGRLAVVDFGIARPYRPGRVGTMIGSPGYAPPEQYQGLATPQSDIYALGATLHRLLTGYDPEQGTPFTFPSIQELNPRVPPSLAAVVARATRLAPDERYPSAGAMATALRQAVVQDRLGTVPFAGQAQPPDRPWIGYVLPFAGALLLIPIMSLAALRPARAPASHPHLCFEAIISQVMPPGLPHDIAQIHVLSGSGEQTATLVCSRGFGFVLDGAASTTGAGATRWPDSPDNPGSSW